MRPSLIAALLFSLAWPVMAQGETPAQPAAPAPRKQLFDDWLLVCATPPGATAETCEIDTALQPEAQTPPVAKVAFVRGGKDEPLRLVAIVQANLTLQPGVEIAPDAGKGGIILAFKSCLNSACLADAILSDDQLQSFRSQTSAGRMTIRNAAGETLSLKLPLHGLDKALDALAAQPGQ